MCTVQVASAGRGENPVLVDSRGLQQRERLWDPAAFCRGCVRFEQMLGPRPRSHQLRLRLRDRRRRMRRARQAVARYTVRATASIGSATALEVEQRAH